jgi:hypothetical protein
MIFVGNPSLNPSPLRGEGLMRRFTPPLHAMGRGLGGGVQDRFFMCRPFKDIALKKISNIIPFFIRRIGY